MAEASAYDEEEQEEVNKGHGCQFRYCNIDAGLTLAMAVASPHPHDAACAMA